MVFDDRGRHGQGAATRLDRHELLVGEPESGRQAGVNLAEGPGYPLDEERDAPGLGARQVLEDAPPRVMRSGYSASIGSAESR